MKVCFFSILTVLFLQNAAWACSYAGSPDVPFSYFIAKTNNIFLAEIAEKRTIIKNIERERVPVHYYKLDIIESVKGIKRKFLRFHLSEYRRSMCESIPPNMKIGEKWVIFGDYDEGKGAFIYNLRGRIYDRWINHSKAPGRYEEIKNLVRNPVTTIQGEIEETENVGFTSMPAKDVEVSIEGEKFRSKTKTDDEGRYIFSGIPAGKYKITIHLKYTAFNVIERSPGELTGKSEFSYEETIRDGDSEYKFFDFQKFPVEN